MNLDKLINNLGEEGAKKKLENVAKTTIFAVIFLTIYLIILLEIFGIRDDFFVIIKDFSFQAELFLNVFLIIFAIFLVVNFRLPSLENREFLIYILLSLFILFSSTVCFGCCEESDKICGAGYNCLIVIILFSLVPMFFLMAILRLGILTNYLVCVLAIGLASGSFAYLAERLVNVTQDRFHLIIWHFSPIFLVVLISSILVKKLIKKL